MRNWSDSRRRPPSVLTLWDLDGPVNDPLYESQSGKTGDGSGEEGNKVVFVDGWLLGTLLDEGLVVQVAF